MLIEQAAYSTPWRQVCPAAKGVFAVGGLVAAYGAAQPASALAVAGVLAAVTLFGARVPFGVYVRVLGTPLFFLLLGGVSLAVSFDPQRLTLTLAEAGLAHAAMVLSRALAAIAALLFLALSTPLVDLVALLRSLRVPETLLEMMVIAYRMLFVFAEARRDIACAQAARLGYASPARSMRALGVLVGALAVQVWQRAADLHVAALARNNDGPLRFLARSWPQARRDIALAALASLILVGVVFWQRGFS